MEVKEALFMKMLHMYLASLVTDFGLRYQSNAIAWILGFLESEKIDMRKDSFYISTTLFSPTDSDILQTIKIKHIANMILLTIPEAPDYKKAYHEIWDSVENLQALYGAARNQGMPIEITEGFIGCWIEEQFNNGKKYCQYGQFIFSPDDSPSKRRIQVGATGEMLQKIYVVVKDKKPINFSEILGEITEENKQRVRN